MSEISDHASVTEQLSPFLREVFVDFSRSLSQLTALDDDVNRRAVVRSVFFYIEAYLNFLSEWLRRNESTASKLTPLMRQALSEKVIDVKENGNVRVVAAKMALMTRVRLVLRCYMEAFSLPLDGGFLFNDNGWKRFRNAIKVRDRIVHPKSADQIKVSTDELRDVLAAGSWFNLMAHFIFYAAVYRDYRGFLTRQKFEEKLGRVDTTDEAIKSVIDNYEQKLVRNAARMISMCKEADISKDALFAELEKLDAS